MDYKQHIERSIAYIEANLTAELGLTDLAGAAGYSEYHFLRIFKQATGLTPADYIRKRRLSEIAREIEHNGRPVSDIAFAYGFNSKENFSRAFKSEHNILPTAYKASGNSLKLYDRLRLDAAPFAVAPEIVTLEGFSLTVYPSAEDYPPKFWNVYNCQKRSLRLSGGAVCADYGVSRWDVAQNRLDYYIGVRTADANGDLAGTVPFEIPGGCYARFRTPTASHFDFVNTIHRTWDYINRVWLTESGYYRRDAPEFETYVENSRTFSEDIFIPIAPK